MYTGSSVAALTPVAGNDDVAGGNTSLVTFNAVAGATYQIAVDGYNGAPGNITLNVALTATALSTITSPTGRSLAGSTATVSGTDGRCHPRSGRTDHRRQRRRQIGLVDLDRAGLGNVTVSTAGSNFDTLLGVYTGTSVPGLTLIGGNDDVAGGNTSQ